MRRGSLWRLLVSAALVFAFVGAAAAETAKARLALVVGNAAYGVDALPTAANDAGLVAQSLAQSGFDVTAMGDTDAATLRRTIAAFVDKVRAANGSAFVFVYLSGYGVQYAGENFVVPVDARIERQADVPVQAVPLSEITSPIEALPAQARIFAFDLARENSIARADAVPLAGGLALVRAPRGSLYAINAAPGAIAQADVPSYGLYARALAEMVRTPRLTVATMFARIRLRVVEVTGGAVVPWDDANLDADVALVSPDALPLTRRDDRSVAGLPPAAAFWEAIAQDRLATYAAFIKAFPDDVLGARVKMMAAVRLEAATWSESVRINSPVAYWTYMERYPRGPHYVDVRRRLAAIRAALEPPPRFDLYDFADLPPPSPDQLHAADRPDLTFDESEDLQSPKVPEDLLPPPSAAIYLDLAPPPLVPRGVLPIPAPFSIGASPLALEVPGPIVQPFVPDIGRVLIQSRLLGDTAATSLSTDAGPMTRTITTAENGTRSIVETDTADEVLSRTTVAHSDGPVIAITQTGADGSVLMKIVTRIDPLGQRSTTITNGFDQVVASVQANPRGVVTEVTRGAAMLEDATFALPAGETGLRAVPRPVLKPVATAPVPPSADPVPLPAVPLEPASPPPVVTPASPPPEAAAQPSLSPPVDVSNVPMPVPRPLAAKPRRGAAAGRVRH